MVEGLEAGQVPEVPDSDLVSLHGLTECDIGELEETFRTEAFDTFGVRLDLGRAPEEHQVELEYLLRNVVERFRRRRASESAEPE